MHSFFFISSTVTLQNLNCTYTIPTSQLKQCSISYQKYSERNLECPRHVPQWARKYRTRNSLILNQNLPRNLTGPNFTSRPRARSLLRMPTSPSPPPTSVVHSGGSRTSLTNPSDNISMNSSSVAFFRTLNVLQCMAHRLHIIACVCYVCSPHGLQLGMSYSFMITIYWNMIYYFFIFFNKYI